MRARWHAGCNAIEALGSATGTYDAVVASELDNMTRADFARQARHVDAGIRVVFAARGGGVPLPIAA